MKHYHRWKRSEQLYADVEFFWRTSLYDGGVKESLRIKTTQWRRGGVLEEQAPLIEDMDSYFIKWKEWINTGLV